MEDELIIAISLKKELEKQGFELLPIVSKADEAVQMATKYEPNLIIMDILLNGPKNGIEAAYEISQAINTNFLFLTGNEYMLDNLEKKLKANFRILSKPATEKDVLHTINELHH